jgi:voltage-gated potassium channel
MDERSRRVAKRFDVPMLIASLLVIPLLLIDATAANEPWTTIGNVLNWGTWLAFLTELVVMLIVVPDRRLWLRTHPVEVVSVVLTPPVLPTWLASARLLRLLRVLRLARLAPVTRRLFTLQGVEYAALVAFVLVLGSATAFAAVQTGYDEWDGAYWAIGTMTTAGSGDVAATETLTQAIGILLMGTGLAFASLLVGAVAQRFMAPAAEQEPPELTDAEICAELRALTEHVQRLDAAIRRRGARAD